MKRLLGVVNVLPYLIKVVLFVVEMSGTPTSYLKRARERKKKKRQPLASVSGVDFHY